MKDRNKKDTRGLDRAIVTDSLIDKMVEEENLDMLAQKLNEIVIKEKIESKNSD